MSTKAGRVQLDNEERLELEGELLRLIEREWNEALMHIEALLGGDD